MQDPVSFAPNVPPARGRRGKAPVIQMTLDGYSERTVSRSICDSCDLEWEPSHQELANVVLLLDERSRLR
jgi:hypothetical protein